MKKPVPLNLHKYLNVYEQNVNYSNHSNMSMSDNINKKHTRYIEISKNFFYSKYKKYKSKFYILLFLVFIFFIIY